MFYEMNCMVFLYGDGSIINPLQDKIDILRITLRSQFCRFGKV